MSVMPILKSGNPVLAERSLPVGPEHSGRIGSWIADMVETMRAAGGVGLAAPQVGISLRFFIFEVPATATTDQVEDREMPLQVLINPEIGILDPTPVLAWEGCLSLPGLRGEVPRPARIRYTGVDARGDRVDRIATGFHARVVQHEFDHLEGILYPERMTDMRRFGYIDEISAPDGGRAP